MAYTREDQDAQTRARALRESIGRLSVDPRTVLGANYDPRLAADIAGMQAELQDVESAQNQANIDRTLGLFDRYSPQVDEAADRNAINELFQTQQDSQLKALNEMFAQQRGQAIEEAAATGNLRQPAFQTSQLNNIDALKAKAVEQLFAELGIGKNQAILDANQRNRELGFNKARTAAGIMQGGQQFGDELNFGREKFNTQSSLARRGQDLDDLFRRDELTVRRNALDDAKPGLMDKISKGFDIANKGADFFGKIVGQSKEGKRQGGFI